MTGRWETVDKRKKRIAPEEVKEWYRASNLTPLFGEWVDFKHRQACALAARFVALHPDTWDRERKYDLEQFAEETARNVYGSDYTLGFIHGWDGIVPSTLRHDEEYHRGYEDGAQAAGVLCLFR
jgi:hypothetical protein